MLDFASGYEAMCDNKRCCEMRHVWAGALFAAKRQLREKYNWVIPQDGGIEVLTFCSLKCQAAYQEIEQKAGGG